MLDEPPAIWTALVPAETDLLRPEHGVVVIRFSWSLFPIAFDTGKIFAMFLFLSTEVTARINTGWWQFGEGGGGVMVGRGGGGGGSKAFYCESTPSKFRWSAGLGTSWFFLVTGFAFTGVGHYSCTFKQRRTNMITGQYYLLNGNNRNRWKWKFLLRRLWYWRELNVLHSLFCFFFCSK